MNEGRGRGNGKGGAEKKKAGSLNPTGKCNHQTSPQQCQEAGAGKTDVGTYQRENSRPGPLGGGIVQKAVLRKGETQPVVGQKRSQSEKELYRFGHA